jgi:hypothetical protein
MYRNVVALFGAVALLLTATVTLTLSRATVSAGSTGSLKCYSTGGTEKACWTSVRHRSMCKWMQAVSDETWKRQHQRRCTAKCEKNLACDAKHRPVLGYLK